MRRFEQNYPSLFDALETGRHPSLESRRTAGSRRSVPRRPPMVRRARTARRGATWWIAAALMLAGLCGLSLLWSGSPTTGPPDAPEPRFLQVASTARWTPDMDAPRLLLTALPPPAPALPRPAPLRVVPASPRAEDRPQPAVEPAVVVATPEPAVAAPEPVVAEAEPVVTEAAIDAGAVTETRIAGGVAPEPDRAPVPEPAVDPTLAAGVLLPPVKLFTPHPRYPPADWLAAVEGDVTLKAEVDERGLVTAVEVLAAPSPGLGQAAVRALERWRFRPATQDGEPVAAHHLQTFRFSR